jgi:hypothetical protein
MLECVLLLHGCYQRLQSCCDHSLVNVDKAWVGVKVGVKEALLYSWHVCLYVHYSS